MTLRGRLRRGRGSQFSRGNHIKFSAVAATSAQVTLTYSFEEKFDETCQSWGTTEGIDLDAFRIWILAPVRTARSRGAIGYPSPERNEIEQNGWTLWSFQYRTPETLAAWSHELSSATKPVLVFCSRGVSAIDSDRPGGRSTTSDCQRYRWPDDREWQPIPKLIRVPHPFSPGRRVASAFVVSHVHLVERFEPPAIEWLSQGKWRPDALPTRPEYLIRRGGNVVMRGVRAILELRPPYLAVVGL
jgi:hypothetical protein